jgi:ABC-type dipeptide/oligopeptide/nickel transport system permease component
VLTVLVRRLGAALLLVWAVASVTFALVRLAPGDAADLLAPPTASAADAARLRGELGLDRPVLVQYAAWLGRLARGDFGESFAQRRPVREMLAEAAPISLALGGSSLLLTFVAGTALGVVQGTRRGSRVDTALTVLTTVAYAAPSFWLALALVALFTYGATVWGFPPWLRLPAIGVREASGELRGAAAAADLVRHAILPVVVLAVVGAAGVARYARSSVADLAAAEWVRTARAKGARPARVYGRHLLANALPPLVVLLALSLPGTIAGSVFVETVFAWPGMGRLLVTAIGARDYPVVLAATVLYAAVVIAANLAADLAMPLLDPRRRDAEAR